MDKKTLIIVPAFNEEGNIPLVAEEIKNSLPQCDILVVNDCSRDNTSAMARKGSRAKVVDLPHNLGIGGAVQTGFKYAAVNGYDIAVQVDGDGQHIPAEVARLLSAMESKRCDMVIGSRFLDTRSFRTTVSRRAGIKLFYYIFKLLLGIRITDGTSGFRAYNRKCIEYLKDFYPDDYPEPEAIVMLHKKGLRICEVGVRMRERIHGTSSITPIKSFYYMAKVSLSIFLSYMRG